jgi:thiol-disulfide isomerase/thioredoxin
MRTSILLATLLGACATAHPPAAQQLPTTARLFDRDASSSFVAADRYRGKVVVLDFWAGWCGECKRTVPQITRLASAFSADGLVVVGVNAGEQSQAVATYAKELGIDYPIALDPELAFSDQLGAANLPVLLVVDRTGAVVHRSRHVDPETLAVIRKLLHDR